MSRDREALNAYNREYYAAHKEQCKAYRRKWAATHPEQSKATKRSWRQAHPGVDRVYKLKRRFGITQNDFNVLLSSQGGVCAVCGGSTWGHYGPCIDHDHETKRVRGLLCHACNIAAGMVKDSPRIALALVKYLQEA